METVIVVYLVIGLLIASYNLGYEIYNGYKLKFRMLLEFWLLTFLWSGYTMFVVFVWIMGILASIDWDINNRKEP